MGKKFDGLKGYLTYGVGLIFLQAMLSAYVTTPEYSLLIVLVVMLAGFVIHKYLQKHN